MPPIEPESAPGMRARGADAQNEPRSVTWLEETAENGQFGAAAAAGAVFFFGSPAPSGADETDSCASRSLSHP